MPAVLLLTDSQQAPVTVSGGLDKKGKNAPLDGPPSFTTADPSKVTVEADPSGDPNSALIKAVDLTEDAAPVRITVSADARMGPDVQTIEDFIDVTVVAGEAVTLGISTGTVVEQP